MVRTNCLAGGKALTIYGVFAGKFTTVMFSIWKPFNALIPNLVSWQDVNSDKLFPGLEIWGQVIDPYNAIPLVFHAPYHIGAASLSQR